MGKEFSKQMRALGAAEILPVWEGDVDGGDLDEVFGDWSEKLVRVLNGGGLGNEGMGVGYGGKDESDYELISDSDEEDGEENGGDSGVVDLEDIAGKAPSRKSTIVVKSNGKLNGEKEMVTPVIRASLEKQVLFKFIIGCSYD